MLPQQSIIRVNFRRLAKSWMTGFKSRKFIGLNNLGLIGSSIGKRIQNFSNLKHLNEDKKNLIQGITDSHGNWLEEMEVVAGLVVQYFDNIFSSGLCNQIEECPEAILQKLTSNMQQNLSRKFNVDEIKVALFQMRPKKDPRPDGMNALFYN